MKKITWIKIITLLVIAALIFFCYFVYILFKPAVHDTSIYRNWSRLRVIGQTQSSLELYFEDNKKYPADLSALVPKYLGLVTSFPVLNIKNPVCPLAEPYLYEVSQDMKGYKITFCLPESSNEYKAGYQIATQNKLVTPTCFR